MVDYDVINVMLVALHVFIVELHVQHVYFFVGKLVPQQDNLLHLIVLDGYLKRKFLMKDVVLNFLFILINENPNVTVIYTPHVSRMHDVESTPVVTPSPIFANQYL